MGCTWSAITRLRAPNCRRSSTSAPASAAARSTTRSSSSTFAPARGRPRSSGAVRVSTLSQRSPRNASASLEWWLEGGRIPVRRADVVHADVEAAELVARPGVGGATLEGGDLRIHHVAHARAVGRAAGVGQPEPARQPLRPRLERDSPLQLAAAVRDRVAEGQHAELCGGFGGVGGHRRQASAAPGPRLAIIPRRVGRGARSATRCRRAAECLPAPLAPLATVAYNYRWAWDPDGPTCSAPSTRERWERCAENPVRLLQEASRAAARRRPPTTAPARARRRARASASAPTSRARAAAGPATPERPVAYFCAEYGVHGSLPDLLRRPRRAGRRHPQGGVRPGAAAGRRRPAVPQGYFRQRIDASGWQHEYWVDTDPDRLPAALVTRRRRHAAHGHACRSATARSPRRSGASTSAACRSSCSTPTARRTPPSARWITLAALRRRPRTRGWRSTCCSASAACARWPRWASSPASCTSTRATRRSCRWSSHAPTCRRRARSTTRWRRPRARTVFTTHTPVPAGNDTYPADAGRGGARAARAARSAWTPRRSIRARPHAPRRGARAVRRHAVRAAHEPHAPTACQPPPRRGGARDVARPVARPRRSTTSRSRHVTNGVHMPTWLGQPMRAAARPPPRRGWLHRADRPRDLGARRRHPRRRSCGRRAASSARELVELRPPAQRRSTGSARDEPRDYAEAAARVRPRRADARLRPPRSPPTSA